MTPPFASNIDWPAGVWESLAEQFDLPAVDRVGDLTRHVADGDSIDRLDRSGRRAVSTLHVEHHVAEAETADGGARLGLPVCGKLPRRGVKAATRPTTRYSCLDT